MLDYNYAQELVTLDNCIDEVACTCDDESKKGKKKAKKGSQTTNEETKESSAAEPPLGTISEAEEDSDNNSYYTASDIDKSYKLKASDLPHFSKKPYEDVDKWINQLDIIHVRTQCRSSELLKNLPLILKGDALEWYTNLEPRY